MGTILENKMSITLFIQTTETSSMLFCFAAASKWWIQLTCNYGSYHIQLILNSFYPLAIISIQWSLCSQVRKWGTQQAATLHIFNFSCRIVWTDNWLSYSDVTIFLIYCCDCIRHILCTNDQWSSSMRNKCISFSAFEEGLMPMEDCRIFQSFHISVCFVHQLHSLCCRFI